MYANLSDIPLDIPNTHVQQYRLRALNCLSEERRKEDISFKNHLIVVLNRELREVAALPRSRWKLETSQTLLKRRKRLCSLCCTAKYPLTQSWFKQIPTAINEKILTFLTGLGDLHTRVVWLSMRSELDKYDRAFIKYNPAVRAESGFLDRVSMNLFQQLRRNKIEMNVGKTLSFIVWQEQYLESIRLKSEKRKNRSRQEAVNKEKEQGPDVNQQISTDIKKKKILLQETMGDT